MRQGVGDEADHGYPYAEEKMRSLGKQLLQRGKQEEEKDELNAK